MDPRDIARYPLDMMDLDETACAHEKVMPTFDEAAAKGLHPREIRQRWPRFHGVCPTCNAYVIAYASFAHYLAGDW